MSTEKNIAGQPENTISQKEEKIIPHIAGMPILILNILLTIVATYALIQGCIDFENGSGGTVSVVLITASIIYYCLILPILCAGLKIVKPNEAYVFTLFGKYAGSLKQDGYYFVNPFVSAINPLKVSATDVNRSYGTETSAADHHNKKGGNSLSSTSKTNKISLKAMTLNNNKQKINDLLGNPIEIGIVVVWRIVNTAHAVFNVDNYEEYLSMQCDSSLRNIIRLYPYDVPEDDAGETSLRGSSQEIALKLREAIQEKVDVAGLEVIEARITHLAYAPEIAAAMLQRQQASAIVDARSLIVKGAVGMVKQALSELEGDEIVSLDEERKAAMVSNLLVVLCGNKDAQPIVNSGTLY